MVKTIYSETEDNTCYVAHPEFPKKDKVAVKDENIEIQFDYPLSKPVFFKFKKKDGFSVNDILKHICETYTQIYLEEDQDDGLTGNIPGMMNRSKSEGRYGIWGHSIQDLVIERVYYNKDKKLITLSIGS